jgi:hypothetical protein
MRIPGFTAESALRRSGISRRSPLVVMFNKGVAQAQLDNYDGECPPGFIFCACGNSASCCDAKHELCLAIEGNCVCVPRSLNAGSRARTAIGYASLVRSLT